MIPHASKVGNKRLAGIDGLVCLILILAILIVYWPVRGNSFITYDDDQYVTQNSVVRAGLTLDGIEWAFSFNDAFYWHPLTWISHMLDCQLYGLDPGMHHTTNLILHILNSLLVFVVFRRMSGKRWQSAMVAGLFALHPLNVESVAWVAERKNLLSTLFWMLTMMGYIRYAEHPGKARYVLMVLFFILGLMAKPMLVTLPFVLLLMDFWPLQRIKPEAWQKGFFKEINLSEPSDFQKRTAAGLIREKIPLFIISLISIFLSSLSIQRLGVFLSSESKPVMLRISNALVAYVKYLGKLFWPQNFAIIYPFPNSVAAWQSLFSLMLLLGLTAIFLTKIKRMPFLIVGWLWFIGTLLPVIGLVQAGFWPAMADRFAYIPAIGVFIICSWSVPLMMEKWHLRRLFLTAAPVAALLILGVITSVQVGFWRNNITLFEHALDVTQNNYLIHNNLGNAYLRQGQIDKAIGHYSESLRINPNFALTQNNMGAAMLLTGNIDEAIFHFQSALKINPGFLDARKNLNKALAGKNRTSDSD